MKKLLMKGFILMVLSLAVVVPSLAQVSFDFGAKLGFSSTGMFGNDIEKTSFPKLGFIGGVFLRMHLSPQISLQAEGLYSQKGTRGLVDNFGVIDTMKVKMDYFEIPVLFKYEFPMPGLVKPGVFAGPVMAVKLAAKAESDDNIGLLASEADIYNATGVNLGFIFGLGFDVGLGGGKALLDIRYTLSLSKAFMKVVDPGSIPSDEVAFIYDDGRAVDLKHGGFSFMIGYAI